MAIDDWTSPERALEYLARADSIPHRTEGEAVLLDLLPPDARRILDLGTGDGRLLALALLKRPEAQGVALDISPPMLRAVRDRFAGDDRVSFVAHNLNDPLPDLGSFDAVISSFAIHHCPHERKRSLQAEIFKLLAPGGLFANLEHVAAPTASLHRRFLDTVDMTEDHDPSNMWLDMGIQLRWLHEAGFIDVDCYWKWLEYALLAGFKPW